MQSFSRTSNMSLRNIVFDCVKKCKKCFGLRSMSVLNQTKNATQVDLHQIRAKNGTTMHYFTKGNGPQPLLVLPAAFGMAQIQLATILNRLDYSKFKVYGWDPIGFGHNQFRLRDYSEDFHFNDAAVVGEVMEIIGVEKFKVFGYCDGGIIGMILAASKPQCVTRFINVHSRSLVFKSEMENLRNRNVHEMHNILPHKSAGYGPEYIKFLANALSEAYENIYYKKNGNICHHILKDIKCPTLIIGGDDDDLVVRDQAYIIQRQIPNSRYQAAEQARSASTLVGTIVINANCRVKMFPKGRHQVFEVHTEEFMQTIHDFYAEDD